MHRYTRESVHGLRRTLEARQSFLKFITTQAHDESSRDAQSQQAGIGDMLTFIYALIASERGNLHFQNLDLDAQEQFVNKFIKNNDSFIKAYLVKNSVQSSPVVQQELQV